VVVGRPDEAPTPAQAATPVSEVPACISQLEISPGRLESDTRTWCLDASSSRLSAAEKLATI
jgi:hypothetical protein